MTIVIEPENEEKLRETARREGEAVDDLANALLAEILQQREREFAENVAAIQDGFEAAAQGRQRPLEEYIIEQRTKLGLPESWPSAPSESK